jgi:hypothetical protein
MLKCYFLSDKPNLDALFLINILRNEIDLSCALAFDLRLPTEQIRDFSSLISPLYQDSVLQQGDRVTCIFYCPLFNISCSSSICYVRVCYKLLSVGKPLHKGTELL